MTDTTPLPPRPKKDDPDYIEKRRAYQQAYYARPEVKERKKERMRAYYARPEVKERVRVRAARPETKEKRRAYDARPEVKVQKKGRNRAYSARPENKEKRRAYHFKHKYGLAPQEKAAMIAAQNGLCAICGKPPNGKKSHAVLGVDHCHKTDRVRAMLCSKCNLTIGFVNDDTALLRKMADYIESYR